MQSFEQDSEQQVTENKISKSPEQTVEPEPVIEIETEKVDHSDSGLDSSDSRDRTIKEEVTESVQLLKSLQITEKRDEKLPTDDIVLPSPTEEALEDLLSIIPQVTLFASPRRFFQHKDLSRTLRTSSMQFDWLI